MTPDAIAKLRALLAKATPGPLLPAKMQADWREYLVALVNAAPQLLDMAEQIADLKAQLVAANSECRKFKAALQEVPRRAVKLPQRWKQTDDEDPEFTMQERDDGRWLSADEVIDAIKAAGCEVQE